MISSHPYTVRQSLQNDTSTSALAIRRVKRGIAQCLNHRVKDIDSDHDTYNEEILQQSNNL